MGGGWGYLVRVHNQYFFFPFRFLLSISRGTNIFRVVVVMRYIPGAPVPTCSALSRRLLGTIRQSALSRQGGVWAMGDSGWLYLIPHCRSFCFRLEVRYKVPSIPSFFIPFFYLPVEPSPSIYSSTACCRNHVNTISQLAPGTEEPSPLLTRELAVGGMLSPIH